MKKTSTSKKTKKLLSKVEDYYLSKSKKKLIYEPSEKIPVIQVGNFPELGKLTALRFIEWVQQNPGGVISLPTGKTPEHFISWVTHFLQNWEEAEVVEELKIYDIDPTIMPDMQSLHFVQIDEFYPIDPYQHNSFFYYINKYYMKNLNLDPEKALLINTHEIGTAEDLTFDEIFPGKKVDLSLRVRWASNRMGRLQKQTIEMVDEYCTKYEKRIRDLGGIGFFLGGIGPDGHIGFNVQGSDHYSTTRLIETNYETQAAAATDLGGIEVAKNSLVITIGLDTIAYNKDVTALIIAAGEAKSIIVRDSIESEANNKYPASVLTKLPNSRFYLTDGAAIRLMERRYTNMGNEKELTTLSKHRAILNRVVELRKPVKSLTEEDYKGDKGTAIALERSGQSVEELNKEVYDDMMEKFNRGNKPLEDEVFFHTAPHHDDIMLGYLPYLVHLVRSPRNRHHFAYMTSGFTAVTNKYMLNLLEDLREHLKSKNFQKMFNTHYFDPQYTERKDDDVHLYLDSIAEHTLTKRRDATSRRLLRNLIEIYEEDNIIYLKDRVDELINYFTTQYPGKKDIPSVQRLKGMTREWEADLLWAYFGFSSRDVSHMRLGFYKGNIFTEEPTIERDVIPIYEMIKKLKPTVITIALDPEGSGPDTHYKVLQAVTEALRLYEKEADVSNIRIWGYRNVWFRFHPAEANVYVPMSLNSMAIMENAFMNCFGSQRAASFPSFEYDGPFNRLAQKIQVDQYQKIRSAIGKAYFMDNPDLRIRASHGMVFLKELTVQEFYEHSLELKKSQENL